MTQFLRILGALGRHLFRSWALCLARLRPLFKKSQSFARLFRVLSRETCRPGSILGRPDAPRLDFGAQTPRAKKVFWDFLLGSGTPSPLKWEKSRYLGSFMAHLRRNLKSTWPQLGTSCPQLGEKFPSKKVRDSKNGTQEPRRPSQSTIFLDFSALEAIFSNFRPLQATVLIQSLGVFPCRKGGGANPSSRKVGGDGV